MIEEEKSYRGRIYRNYLTVQAQFNIKQIQQGLKQRAPYLKKIISRWIPKDRNIRVLELGCGYGALLYFLKQAGYENIKGVDGSPEQITAAIQLGLDFIQEGNVLETLKKTESDSHEVIIAFDVLEHFTKQEIFPIMDEIYRVLRSGGKFVFHVPNGEAIFPARIYFGDLTHETCFTRQSILQLAKASGFISVSLAEDVPVVHGFKSGVRYLLWKVLRNSFRLIYMAETGDIGRDLLLTQNIMAVAEKE